ncbi:hypothetical protein MKX01_018666 [Papaver californicum]|nr:hypothetical protein MKX01_018666 [Papaver californicum]
MEEPTNEDAAAVIVEVKDDSTPHSQRKNPRRKLVQSRLFPHKPQVNEINAPLSQETHEDIEVKGDCNSPIGKRKRKGKGGGSAKKASPKKRAPDLGKEVAAAGIAEDGSSPLAAGKKSNRRAKEKLQGDASPCKVLTPSSSKGKCRRQLMTNCPSGAAEGQTEHAEVPVIDLRLEAKLAAEENAKLFAGKQTHPFFSARKLDKRSQETVLATEPESKSCLVLPDDLHPPIHVFEKLQAQEYVLLNWTNWSFCDEALISSNNAPETASSSVFEGSVKPLSFNDFLVIPNSVETSPPKNDMSLNRCSQAQMNSISPINSPTSAGFKAQERNEVDLSEECTYSINNSFVEHRDGFSQERMPSYNIYSGSQPDSSLWATKYQPRKASEVCGNGDSVKFLNEWLQYWREKRPQANKNSALNDKFITLDSDCSSDENYSDAESVDDEGLKIVLLVTGPVGSGKSAAIYACAKEQGFEVIEVSASDWRNGAHVKQKFGEAMESHRFSKWSSEDSTGSQMKNILSFSSVQNVNSSDTLNTDVVEVISETCLEEPEIVEVERENLSICNRVTNKSLILFEDVDTIFDEDRGLISTIQQLAEKAKRPMILTCNSQDPILPYQLDRLEVRFEVPSSEELLTCLRKICTEENADIPTLLLERFLGCCQGDIRKTIMLLQFWCQGIRNKKERELQLSYPLQLDLDAWHWVLLKVIPWGFPCQLSELVDKEITKVFTTSRQSTSLLEIVEEEELSLEKMQDASEIGYYNETDSIVAKKQAMLSMNGSLHEGNGFSTQFNGVAEFSNSSGSPVAFTRRNAKKRQSTVFSSLSGDECTENIAEASNIMPNYPDNEMPEGDLYKYLADSTPVQTSVDIFTSQQHYFNRELSELNLFRYSETENQQMCDTSKSVDVSCVPESSYVAKTEINGVRFQPNTVCCGEASVSVGAVSLSGANSFPCFSMNANNLEEVIPDADKNSDTILRTANDRDAETAHGDEKTGDTHIEHGDSPIRGYQGMDECSRADFNKISTLFEEDRCLGEINPVEEAWKNLRCCREDLKLHVTSEMKEASQFQALVSGMADLISEADLMLGCCQPLLSDFIEMPVVPNVEPDTVYWSDKQLEMTSAVVQHGLGHFAKESAKTGPNFGLKKTVDIAWEMFACTTNTTELGKVLTQDLTASQISCVGRGSENGPLRTVSSSKSGVQEHLNNTIQSLVPSRLLLALRGSAFSDYVSSLSQISKFEASRLSNNIDKPKNRRRGRAAHHYLSAGQLMLSPEDVSLLAQQNCYGKVSGE